MAEEKLQGVTSSLEVYPGTQMTAQDFANLLQWGLSIPGFGTRLSGAVITKASGSNTAIDITKGWILYAGRIIKIEAASSIELTNLPASSNDHGIYIKVNLSTGTAELVHDEISNIPSSTLSNYSGTAGSGVGYFRLAKVTTDSNSHIGTITMDSLASRRIYAGVQNPANVSGLTGLNGDIYIKYST